VKPYNAISVLKLTHISSSFPYTLLKKKK